MRYACLIYYHPKTLFGGSAEANAVLAECATYDDKLKEGGHFVMGEALELPESAMTVQVRGGKMSSVDAPFMVIYLIFNEGYSATQGPDLIRTDLCARAIRLGRLVVDLLDEPEALGLLGLMLLHEARQSARVDSMGDLVLLENQDRLLWDRKQITEAQQLIERAFAARRVGPYILQAAIAAVHAEAQSVGETGWARIVALYDVLVRVDPSPVVALNRAVAIGMREGPDAGLAAIDTVLGRGGLNDYHLAHAARADMQRRLGLAEAARASYQRALELTHHCAERRFLQARLTELAREQTNERR